MQHIADISGPAYDTLPVGQHIAFGRQSQTRNDIKKRRFSAAARSDNTDKFTFLDIETGRPHGLHLRAVPAKAFAHAAYLNFIRRHNGISFSWFALHTLQPQRDKKAAFPSYKKTAVSVPVFLDAGLSEAAIFMNRFFVSKKLRAGTC